MATLARYSGVVLDDEGNVIPSASVRVEREVAGSPLASLYSDRAGATGIGNPFNAEADGTFSFHVIGGAYKITVTSGAYTRTRRYVAIGTAGEYDVNDALTPGHRFTFDTTTADADPGTAKMRANNGTFGSITELYVDDEDIAGNDVSAWLEQLDDYGSASARGYLWIQDPTDATKYMLFLVTGSVVDGTGYHKITVTPVDGALFEAAEIAALSFFAVGGGGDMAAAIYDPTAVADDAFDMANMAEAADAKVMTADERSKLEALGQENLLLGAWFATAPWQRGTSFTSATTPANNDDTYLADRWVLISEGNDAVDVSQAADGSMFLEAETANAQFGLVQIVEAADCAHIIGDAVSIAARLKGSGISLVRMAVLAWTGTADAVTSDVISAWGSGGTEPTWATNWTREGSILDIVPGASYATSEQENIAVDTASAKQIAIVIWVDDGTITIGDSLNIEWLSCVAGATHPTAPRFRSAAEEVDLCQRYYEEWGSGVLVQAPTLNSATSDYLDATVWGERITFLVRKRVAPTITQTGVSVSGNWVDAGLDGVTVESYRDKMAKSGTDHQFGFKTATNHIDAEL